MRWSDARKPSPGDVIEREDGRTCVVNGYERLVIISPTSKTNAPRNPGQQLGVGEIPPTTAGQLADYPAVETVCGEKMRPRIISMCVFWPAVVDVPASCPKCRS